MYMTGDPLAFFYVSFQHRSTHTHVSNCLSYIFWNEGMGANDDIEHLSDRTGGDLSVHTHTCTHTYCSCTHMHTSTFNSPAVCSWPFSLATATVPTSLTSSGLPGVIVTSCNQHRAGKGLFSGLN